MATITTAASAGPGATTVPAPRRRRRSPVAWVRGGGLMTLGFFVPLLVTFGFFSWWPIARSLVMSVQRTNFIVVEWVGLDNFQRVLSDPLVATAARNTVLFATIALVIGFPMPVLLAVFMAELRKARGFASSLVYVPVIIPPVVAVLLWKTFYDPSPTGLFNTVLGWFNVGPLAWLNDGDIALPALVVEATWAGFGGSTIIYLAALMSIRTDLYEAAEVDGARIRHRFWHITLPQLRTVMLVMALLQIIGTFQVFTEPYLMTGGGPENRTTTVLLLIYRYAFVSGDYGRATALSILLALVLAVLSAVYLWITKRWSTS